MNEAMNELLNIMIEASLRDKNYKLVKKLKPCKNHPLVSVVHRVGKEKQMKILPKIVETSYCTRFHMDSTVEYKYFPWYI